MVQPSLSEAEIKRYARQIVLPELGGTGQKQLADSKICLVGAGGLGTPLAIYLCAAGVGHITLIDDDHVELGNLHRQIFFKEENVGSPKADALAASLQKLNSLSTVAVIKARLTCSNAISLLDGCSLVADGSDNLETRFAVHDAAHSLCIPLVSAAVQGMDGELTTYQAYQNQDLACIRCHTSEEMSADALPSCSAFGVLGPVAGMVACYQAVEVIRLLTGAGPSLAGTLLLVDGWNMTVDRMALHKNPECICEKKQRNHKLTTQEPLGSASFYSDS